MMVMKAPSKVVVTASDIGSAGSVGVTINFKDRELHNQLNRRQTSRFGDEHHRYW
jgi:hypothetical protein